MMFLLFALTLGIVQGLAEFLPISSSGHLALFSAFFGSELSEMESITAFSVLLHLGTLIAVFIVYKKDIGRMIPAFFTMVGKLFRFGKKYTLNDFNDDERMDLYVIIATLPLVFLKLFDMVLEKVANFSLLDAMEHYVTEQPIVVGIILLINGCLLFFSDKLVRKDRPFDDFKPRNALFVGLCQMCAILPGLSRSGSTITGGRFNGLTRSDAVRFSFLLSIPAILGSSVAELPDLFASNNLTASNWIAMLAATAVACIVGLLSMKLLHFIAEKSTFKGFSFYCFAVGALAIIGGIVLLTV